MLKTKTLFFSLCLALTGILFTSSMAGATMQFELDFGQDGTIESTVYLPMEETVIADLYVSNVPEPGLRNMGFTLTYDDSVLALVQGYTAVDPDNWQVRNTDCSVSGEVTMSGGQVFPGLAGDLIKLGTVSFGRIAEGNIDLTISAREDPDNKIDDFVLTDGTVLDDDLDGGIVGITDTPLYDFDEDGDVDGVDLQLMSVCTDNCPSLAVFASLFGTVQGPQ